MQDEFYIKEKGVEEIPFKKKFTPDDLVKIQEEHSEINPEIHLKTKDALPIIKKQLEENLLDTLKSGWKFKHIIGLAVTILTFIALIIINKCS